MSDSRVFKHFSGEKLTDKWFTGPNIMTLSRFIGGPLLGFLMATNKIGPSEAIAVTGALGATDAEGQTIALGEKFPRLQRLFRLYASKLGKAGDAIADKAMILGIAVGGTMNGTLPIEHSAPVVAAEIATSVNTLRVINAGGEPETPNAGKGALAARVGFPIVDMFAKVHEANPDLHQNLQTGGFILALGAAALGAVSAYQLNEQVHIARAA